jgi:hypothetical protein
LGDYFNRRAGKMPTPQESLEVPSLPEVIESPAAQPEPKPEITPEAQSIPLPEKIAPNSEQPELERYFNPRQYPNSPSAPSLPVTEPKIESPTPEITPRN